MQINIIINTENRKDVELAHNTFGYILGFLPVQEQNAAAEMASHITEAMVQVAKAVVKETIVEKPEEKIDALVVKKGRVAKTKIEPVAATGEKVTLADARAKLTTYGADARFGGISGVVALLRTFHVERITDLPEDRYADFIAKIDEALAVNPLA